MKRQNFRILVLTKGNQSFSHLFRIKDAKAAFFQQDKVKYCVQLELQESKTSIIAAKTIKKKKSIQV